MHWKVIFSHYSYKYEVEIVVVDELSRALQLLSIGNIELIFVWGLELVLRQVITLYDMDSLEINSKEYIIKFNEFRSNGYTWQCCFQLLLC